MQHINLARLWHERTSTELDSDDETELVVRDVVKDLVDRQVEPEETETTASRSDRPEEENSTGTSSATAPISIRSASLRSEEEELFHTPDQSILSEHESERYFSPEKEWRRKNTEKEDRVHEGLQSALQTKEFYSSEPSTSAPTTPAKRDQHLNSSISEEDSEMARQNTLAKVARRWPETAEAWARKSKEEQEALMENEGTPPTVKSGPVLTSDEDFNLFIREEGCLVHVRRIFCELSTEDVSPMFEAEIGGVMRRPVAGKFHQKIIYKYNLRWDFCGWAVLHYESRYIAQQIVSLFHKTDPFKTGVPVHVSLGMPKKQILDLFPNIHAAISRPDLDPSGPFPSRNRPVIVPNAASRKNTNPNFHQQILEDLKGKVMANLASSPRPNPKNTPNPPGLPKPLAVEVLKAQQERLKKELGKDKPEPKKIEPEKPKNLGSVLKEQVLRQDPQLEKIPNSTETGILKAQELAKPTNKLKEQLNGLRLELKKENPAMPPPGLSPKTDEAHPKIADPASLGREREVPRREAAQRGPERLDHDVVPQSLEIRVLEPTQRAPERRLQDVQSRARGEGVQEPVRHYPERLEHDVVPESLETWGPEPTQHYSEHRDRRESNSTQSSIPAPPGFEHAVARRQNRDEVRDVRRRDSESSAGPPGLIYQQRKQEDEGYFESRHTSADSLPQPQPVYDTKAIWVHRLPGNYDTQAVAERLRIREDEIVFDHTEPQIVLRYDPYDDRISALIYFLHQNVAKEFHAGWHNQMLDGKILETAYRKC